MNKKIKILLLISKWMMIYGLFISLGFIIGMIYQQLLFANNLAMVLGYSDVEINVNLNATEFANELNNTFIPAWKYAFNETIHNQLNLTGNST